MPVYRPRVLARLFVPNVGEPNERVTQEKIDDVFELQVRPFSLRLDMNNHLEADEAEVKFSFDEAGIDPRFLRNCEIYVYAGNADETGHFEATPKNLRFLGIANEVYREVGESKGKVVRIRALDYTTLFLACKHFPPQGIPPLSMTLREAWNLVCDWTGYYDDPTAKSYVSTVQRLKSNGKNDDTDRLRFYGVDPDLTLGSAVAPRLAKFGKLQPPHGADAWAVWQTAVGSLGLISFIRGDRCVVTTATDFYTSADPPLFALGVNIADVSEGRDVNALSAKNVGVESFDPTTGKAVEAFWPPLSLVASGRKKKLGASALGGTPTVRASDYEIFDTPTATSDPKVLEQVAKRIWEERSRQELRGEFQTAEMFVDTIGGGVFDLLSLCAGDRIRVDVDESAFDNIRQFPSLEMRKQYLVARGYADSTAEFIVKNLDGLTKLPSEFQVRSASTTIDADEMNYETRIEFLNRIDVSGAGPAGTGDAATAPVTGQKKLVANPAGERRSDGRTDSGVDGHAGGDNFHSSG